MTTERVVTITKANAKHEYGKDFGVLLIVKDFGDILGFIMTAFRMRPDKIVIDYKSFKEAGDD